ncbi:MAG: hypothetical protein AVDCRST_MAG66-4593 [uncultured Pseudonocardia sp.]|uniref:SMODS and SLOG-associating 2TM effector domain-containing protein n=1 Tax=uncultured Pseudonocardia sp. TaxID=211455 RepID=A0A6J4QPP2_9PSEU|nr:MAG: hypothetical protein AVDCRST_MAG66-4593 [uncultured Pseudonocardia sp.]
MSGRQEEFRSLYRELRIGEQQRYYDDRRAEYRRAHRQAIVVRNALLVGAALTGIVGQLTPVEVRGGLAVLGAVLGALASAVTGFEALIGFAKLEKLYGDAARNLAEAATDWDVAGPEDLAPEIDRVEEIFRTETGQWGQLVVESAGPAVGNPPVAP